MIKIATGAGPQGELALVQVSITEGTKQSRETTWARPLGNDLYEIKGPLHLVAGFNPKDVVRAVILPGDATPSVLEVVSRSGYMTLHVAFSESVPTEEQQALLETLGKWRATHEMFFERLYTIVVDHEGNFQAVCEFLKSLMAEGLLMYEPEIDMSALHRYRFSNP